MEMKQLARLHFLAMRYENMLKQAIKYNKADLEKVALFINAESEFQIYREKIINKYPLLNNTEIFYYNCSDNYIYF